MPKPLLTPRELAEAIGSSESSVRRWVDAGDIAISRTAGGHRRILLAEAVRFIRLIGAPVLRPDLLGLDAPPDDAAGGAPPGDADRLYEAIAAGDRGAARGLLAASYLKGRGLAELFDGPVREAMHRVGGLWAHDARGILVEHRATQICVDAVAMLQALLPPPETDRPRPLALGGAPEGDPYQLPTMMAAAVVSEAGLRAVNFGPLTPVKLLGREAADQGARLVWLSVSAPQDFKALRREAAGLAATLAANGIDLVLGGRHRAECVPGAYDNVRVADSMADLAALAGKLKGRSRTARPSLKTRK